MAHLVAFSDVFQPAAGHVSRAQFLQTWTPAVGIHRSTAMDDRSQHRHARPHRIDDDGLATNTLPLRV